MTFDEYIVNPMGRSNAVMSKMARESQKNIYKSKFDNILLRENGKIDYYLYKTDGSVYYAHIKIPSEVVPDFYYDVVLKFIGDKSITAGAYGLDKYQVQFFSNDPAFVYTYAYVFRKQNLLVKELEPKMAHKALKTPAKEKNPYNQVGYVKSLYFAYLFMKQRGLFSKVKYTGAQVFNRSTLLSQVENADNKIEKRQELGAKISQRKKRKISSSLANRLEKQGVNTSSLNNSVVTTTKRVGVVKNKAVNSNIKRTKSTKKF